VCWRFHLRLIIAGSGRCVWDDLEQLHLITADVMCINDMIPFYPGNVHHIASCDGPMLQKWWDSRRQPYKQTFPIIPRVHTVDNGMPVGKNVEKWAFQGGGTSGLFACMVGLNLGYDEIILCGIPIDNSGHFWETPAGKTNFQREIANSAGHIRGDGRRFWTRAAEKKFGGKVKSMSGFTRKLLGAPKKKAG